MSRWRSIWLVAKREILERGRSRGFILSVLFTTVLVVGAFVVPSAAVDAATLVAWCRERLASYKVPRWVWLRQEAELPQKASGKADKSALRAEATRLTAGAARS
mgnify:CR=1 FL=1